MKTMNWTDYISIDPGICHGKPCFKGTRIMVGTILELVESGGSNKEIRKSYPSLTSRHIQAALHFAHCLLERASSRELRVLQNAATH